MPGPLTPPWRTLHGQVLGGQVDIDAVIGHVGQHRHRYPGRCRLDHWSLDLAEHLQVAQRVGVVRPGQIPVVEAQGLLEADRVPAARIHGQEKGAVVDHVVASDQARGVGQATGMPIGD